jgi:hypothetical protein
MGLMKKIGTFFQGDAKIVKIGEKEQPVVNTNAPLAKYATNKNTDQK